MSVLEELKKGKFTKGNTELELDSILGEGKLIGVYFSAHWCPPCRGFTPQLVDFYEAIKATKTDKGNNFEIIFISFDRDEDSFNTYADSMPWCKLNFDQECKQSIADAAGVKGIPHFLIMNGSGDVIEGNARNDVGSNPPSDTLDKWLK